MNPADKAPLNASDNATKTCAVCAEPMRLLAKKCLKCGSFQGFFGRRLTLSHTVLALLVALFSVIGYVVPAVQRALERPESDVRVGFIGAGEALTVVRPDEETRQAQLFRFMVSNVGTRAGVIRSVHVILPDPGTPQRPSIINLGSPTPPKTLVQPGEAVEMTWYPADPDKWAGRIIRGYPIIPRDPLFPSLVHELGGTCRLMFEVVRFDTSLQVVVVPFTCIVWEKSK